jgi:SAM-dependent methyltransferase
MTTTYRKEQIERVLREERFPYHRVELPFGLHTPGQDRSATRDVIFPASLAGKTVLDVGCALGYFSFEAEKRGAARVVGVELNEKRLRQAVLLKEILGSRVEFLQRDVLTEPPAEPFDCVCFLNVIHHLPEPMRALRQLAALTRERLMVEFPTFADEKFRKNVGIRFPWFYDRLPLIGVSSMSRETDQTFVFSPGAIRRILQDHTPLFREVKIVDSPMAGRKIALCTK